MVLPASLADGFGSIHTDRNWFPAYQVLPVSNREATRTRAKCKRYWNVTARSASFPLGADLRCSAYRPIAHRLFAQAGPGNVSTTVQYNPFATVRYVRHAGTVPEGEPFIGQFS